MTLRGRGYCHGMRDANASKRADRVRQLDKKKRTVVAPEAARTLDVLKLRMQQLARQH